MILVQKVQGGRQRVSNIYGPLKPDVRRWQNYLGIPESRPGRRRTGLGCSPNNSTAELVNFLLQRFYPVDKK